MKATNSSGVSYYTVAGSHTKFLPDALARRKKQNLKDDAEWQNRVQLLQDFEFQSASAAVRISEDGEWLMSTGTYVEQFIPS